MVLIKHFDKIIFDEMIFDQVIDDEINLRPFDREPTKPTVRPGTNEITCYKCGEV